MNPLIVDAYSPSHANMIQSLAGKSAIDDESPIFFGEEPGHPCHFPEEDNEFNLPQASKTTFFQTLEETHPDQDTVEALPESDGWQQQSNSESYQVELRQVKAAVCSPKST